LVIFETSIEEPKFIQVGVVCGGIKCDEYPGNVQAFILTQGGNTEDHSILGVYANLVDDTILSFVNKIISKKQYFEDMVTTWRTQEPLPIRLCPINSHQTQENVATTPSQATTSSSPKFTQGKSQVYLYNVEILHEVCGIRYLRNNLASLSVGITLPNTTQGMKYTFMAFETRKSNITREETIENP